MSQSQKLRLLASSILTSLCVLTSISRLSLSLSTVLYINPFSLRPNQRDTTDCERYVFFVTLLHYPPSPSVFLPRVPRCSTCNIHRTHGAISDAVELRPPLPLVLLLPQIRLTICSAPLHLHQRDSRFLHPVNSPRSRNARDSARCHLRST